MKILHLLENVEFGQHSLSPATVPSLGRAMEDVTFLSLGRTARKSMVGPVLSHLQLKSLIFCAANSSGSLKIKWRYQITVYAIGFLTRFPERLAIFSQIVAMSSFWLGDFVEHIGRLARRAVFLRFHDQFGTPGALQQGQYRHNAFDLHLTKPASSPIDISRIFVLSRGIRQDRELTQEVSGVSGLATPVAIAFRTHTDSDCRFRGAAERAKE